jgi:hypothetical protein
VSFYRNGNKRTRTRALIRSRAKPAAGSKGPTSHRYRMPCSDRACRSAKGLEIVGREAFEAPNRGDARERVRTHESASKKIQLAFHFFFRRAFARGVLRFREGGGEKRRRLLFFFRLSVRGERRFRANARAKSGRISSSSFFFSFIGKKKIGRASIGFGEKDARGRGARSTDRADGSKPASKERRELVSSRRPLFFFFFHEKKKEKGVKNAEGSTLARTFLPSTRPRENTKKRVARKKIPVTFGNSSKTRTYFVSEKSKK